MDGLLLGMVLFGLGVYFAEPVRKAVPLLDPNQNKGELDGSNL